MAQEEFNFHVDMIERITRLETKMNIIGIISGAAFSTALTLLVLWLTKA